jgi:hypothetical protein
MDLKNIKIYWDHQKDRVGVLLGVVGLTELRAEEYIQGRTLLTDSEVLNLVDRALDNLLEAGT